MPTRRSLKKSMLLATVACVAVTAQSGWAQEADAPEEEIRDQIVVTATRRAESIQTVGLSISAISGEDLQASGAVDFEDFAISVPNLAFGITDDAILAARTISIRGIEGLNTTGFYIDDVPLDESVDPLVLDVERVEVLRGPQGTLYGARGLGGTVRIITKQPEFDGYTSRGHAGFSYTEEGGFNYILDGAVNMPLAENLAMRVIGYVEDQEGVFDKIVGPSNAPGVVVAPGTPGAITGDAPATRENVDDRLTFGGQVALRWQPTSRLDVTGKILAQRTELNGFPLADFAFDPATTPDPLTLNGDDLTQETLFNTSEFGDDQWVQGSINASYETDWGTFSNSVAYFERHTQEGEESGEFVSFTLLPILIGFSPDPVPLSSPIFQELDFRTIVEEARFVSDFDGPFQMTTGIFYQTTDDDESFLPPNIAPGIFDVLDEQIQTLVDLGVPGLPPTEAVATNGDLIFTSDRDLDVREFGVYGEFSYTLFDRLTGTVGVRYFDTETEFQQSASGLANGGDSASAGGQSEDGFNLKGLVEYEANDNVYLYASATEGFRIGGPNGDLPNSPALPCQDLAAELGINDTSGFGSDSLWTYEGGAKTTWQGGRTTLNVTGFYNDFDDIQQRILLACGFSFTANIGSARTTGFELEATTQPVDGLVLGVGAGYTDAQFTEDSPGGVADGDRLQQVPEWTASGMVDYSFPFIGREGFVRGDFAYVGDSISRTVGRSAPSIRPSYEDISLRAGVRDGQLEVTAFIDNVTDERAVLGDNRSLALEAIGRPRIVINRPRTYGVSIRANF